MNQEIIDLINQLLRETKLGRQAIFHEMLLLRTMHVYKELSYGELKHKFCHWVENAVGLTAERMITCGYLELEGPCASDESVLRITAEGESVFEKYGKLVIANHKVLWRDQ